MPRSPSSRSVHLLTLTPSSTVKENSVIAVQIFDQRKFKKRDQGFLGVVNVTPDSFSDGGRLPTAEAAARYAERLLDEGADAVDLGGESTRIQLISAVKRSAFEFPM